MVHTEKKTQFAQKLWPAAKAEKCCHTLILYLIPSSEAQNIANKPSLVT